MNRRNFFKGVAAFSAACLTPVALVIPALQPAVDTLRRYSFSAIVVATLKAKHPKLAENIAQNNALLRMLNERGKVQ